jgi:glycosyltransferase involved in cell wall biosynthesis
VTKLSIITINMNNAHGLRKTIESVISQTFKDFEYIIIDGGSIDGSIEIIRKYASQISYFLSEPDKGIYHAMNKGIKQAKGEFCQFLNSGDLLATPTSTDLILSEMPDCSILYGNMFKQMPGGKIIYNKDIPLDSFLSFYLGTLNHSPVYIKRSLFERYGLYDENLKIVADWKFFLIAIMLNNEKVCYRDVDVTCFDMTGISSTNSILKEAERREVLKALLPVKILADYDKYANGILQIRRINRYKITRWLVWFIERLLFKWEKWVILKKERTSLLQKKIKQKVSLD